MERIVSRSDLRSRSGSLSESSVSNDITDKLADTEEFDFVPPTLAQNATQEKAEEHSDESELEFRLFGTTNTSNETQERQDVSKIKLHSQAIEIADGAFTKPSRDRSYYFTHPLSQTEQENLQTIAFSGDEVKSLAKQPWPGSAYPWKVLSIPITNVDKSIRSTAPSSFEKMVDDGMKRKRPGKKYRIRLRQKQAAVQAKKAAKEAAEAVKERSQREKRSRLNREKKLKKRARDKAKKNAAQISGEDAVQS